MSDYLYIKFFEDLRVGDVPLVGGKNASLGELLSFGISVPLGFAVTSKAFDYVLDTNFYTIKEKEVSLRELIARDINKISDEGKSPVMNGGHLVMDVLINNDPEEWEKIETRADAQVITASVPLSEMFGYSTKLRSISQGRAIYTMQFNSYLAIVFSQIMLRLTDSPELRGPIHSVSSSSHKTFIKTLSPSISLALKVYSYSVPVFKKYLGPEIDGLNGGLFATDIFVSFDHSLSISKISFAFTLTEKYPLFKK